MTDDSVRGRFIWHELRTPNPAGACDFYSTALGWKAVDADDSSHATFSASSGPLGACAQQPPTAVPRWIPFVTVANADDAFREAVELGADAVVEPTAIEGGGRYAVLTDPQGAAIGVYSADDFGEDRDPRPGDFSWHELAATDARAALDFYAALFGWELVREHDMGPMGAYLIVGYDGKQIGGIFNKDSAGMSGEPAWLSYVRVSDLSETIEKVKAARGSVLTGPMEVPGGDWIAQLLDPHGAAFALHAVAADATAEASKAKRAQAEASQAKPAQEEDSRPKRAQEEAAKAKPANVKPAREEARSRLNAMPAAAAITEIWSASDAGGDEPDTTRSSTKKNATKPSTAKAAKSKATKKKPSKAKKTSTKKRTTRQAGGETAAKKAAKKSDKKKAVTKKAAKTKKKTGKKAATKKAAAKKAAKKKPAAKKSGNNAPGKKAGKTAGSSSRKKRGKAAGSGSGKKSGKASSGRAAGSKTAGKKPGKKAGKKARKKSGRG